ncbi:MAG TPA: alpha/beta hydrolase [Tepidisphaeraceae bacterium]|nr:alpha/beta hydrolase [Tepidisphaeraceae bacterium]
MPTTNIGDATFYYETRGQGMPVVLLHGFPLDSRVWESQLEALSDRYLVIAPDLRGFGKSRAGESFTIDSLADDVHWLLKDLGTLPCALGGLSMGGYVALAYAKKYPEYLRGLLLIDTRAEADPPAGRENRNRMIQTVRQHGPKAVADEMFPKMLCDETKQQQPQVAQMLRDIMESQTAEAIEHALEALRDRPDRVPDLPAIACPAQVMVGEHDVITTPAMAKTMDENIPNSHLVTVLRAGHMSPMEQPDQVTTAIRRFLEELTT